MRGMQTRLGARGGSLRAAAAAEPREAPPLPYEPASGHFPLSFSSCCPPRDDLALYHYSLSVVCVQTSVHINIYTFHPSYQSNTDIYRIPLRKQFTQYSRDQGNSTTTTRPETWTGDTARCLRVPDLPTITENISTTTQDHLPPDDTHSVARRLPLAHRLIKPLFNQPYLSFLYL